MLSTIVFNNSSVVQKTARNRVEQLLFFSIILDLVNNTAKNRPQGQGLEQGLHSQGHGQYSQGQGQGIEMVPKDS